MKHLFMRITLFLLEVVAALGAITGGQVRKQYGNR